MKIIEVNDLEQVDIKVHSIFLLISFLSELLKFRFKSKITEMLTITEYE